MVGAKIAVIGDRDTVVGLKMAGVHESAVPKSPEETRRRLVDYFRDPGVGLILITERLAEPVEDTILELSRAPVPVILLIPDRDGSTGVHDHVVRELIRRAVGIEVKI